MTGAEKRAVAGLAGILALRMFGLFLLLPVLAVYARSLPGSTPLLVGIAVGSYGLSQALLQIPFGWWSDRLGRKQVITIGLVIFALGSILAASGDHIVTVTMGRLLQGAGAIAAAVLALTADLTREQNRHKAMAVLGMAIGAVFMVSLVAGPALARILGVKSLFWITAGLALVAIVALWRFVPTPARSVTHRDVQTAPEQIRQVLTDPHLLRLNSGIFMLHAVLTALFVSVPLALTTGLGIEVTEHWKIYLSVLVCSIPVMIPLILLAGRGTRVFTVMPVAVGLLLAAQFMILFRPDYWGLAVGLWLFFCGFNTLEALLPSLVSQLAPVAGKGTAIGVYNTWEFFGVFVGGATAGWIHGAYGITGVAAMCAGGLGIWLLGLLTGSTPALFDSRLLRINGQSADGARTLSDELSRIPGVLEATVVAEESVAYVRVDSKRLDEDRLVQFELTQIGDS
ncbi:MAG: Inner membrane transport protein YajR [Gammaproteobacteria bacterium]|nr:Inner membrane transport protein YajR [Gammaproteobacteria bacterium]